MEEEIATHIERRQRTVPSGFLKVGTLTSGTKVEVFFQGQNGIRSRQDTVILGVNPTRQEGNPQVLISRSEGTPRSIGGGTLCRRFF